VLEIPAATVQALQLSLNQIPSSSPNHAERYFLEKSQRLAVREVLRRSGGVIHSSVPLPAWRTFQGMPAADAFDAAWLRLKKSPFGSDAQGESEVHRVADLFCGCGGLSLGVGEALRALGKRPDFVFACDIDKAAIDVYEANFTPRLAVDAPIEQYIDGKIGATLTPAERALKRAIGGVDFVIAGPPCQGHSDLNNHTRRDDPKNKLVTRVTRFVEIFRPAHVLIENVQGIRHDKSGSLQEAKRGLAALGYSLDEALLRADEVGAAQTRRRYLLVASRGSVQSLFEVPLLYPGSARPLSWAIGDLLDLDSQTVFDTPAKHSSVNKQRIDYLHDHGLYELPDSERPPCHRDGNHSYKSVYGRMYWDRPAPTITTGFGSIGQGRFGHPLKRRTLTPHEAARVQFFPDFFNFGERGRRDYQSLIGNAVPSKLAYAVALHQLR